MVIVRTRFAGVYFAKKVNLDRATGFAKLFDASILWRWQGAATTLELATRGPAQPDRCKAPGAVPTIEVGGVVAITPCSAEAEQRLRAIPVWTAHAE